jgi:Mor family transcriptional regulator
MPDLFAADAETLAPLAEAMPDGLHPTLREMCEEMFLHLLEDEELVGLLEADRLAELVVGLVDRVAMKLGGSGFYLPKGIGCKLSARDREIVQAYNGRNKHLLARQHKVSEVRIDQILKKWRQDEFARKQGKLDLCD